MELILYYISKSQNLLITFLILMFVIGVIAYLVLRNFRQDKKMKIFSYGLFLGMNSMDVFKLSIIVVRSFLAIYATLITDETIMFVCLIMIIILTLIYIIFSLKRIFFESLYVTVQLVMIYFIYIINGYMSEIENTTQILILKICLTALIVIFTLYLLFDNIEVIAKNRVDKNLKKDRADERKRLLDAKNKKTPEDEEEE